MSNLVRTGVIRNKSITANKFLSTWGLVARFRSGLRTPLIACLLGLVALSSEAAAERPAPFTEPTIPLPLEMGIPPLDGVFLENGMVYHLQNGERSAVTIPQSLGSSYEVRPDGSILLKEGSPVRRLVEGELFCSDGTLIRANGESAPVQDHVVRKIGALESVANDQANPIGAGHRLTNGTILLDYGKMILPDGTYSHLADGQILSPDGSEIQAWDTVTFRDGKVSLYKDGAIIELASGRSMRMNDGTLVTGDGTVARRTAESGWQEVRAQLSDGSILRLPGPINLHRLRPGR